MKLLSRVGLFAVSWIVAYQVPPSMAFSRQEYWSGLKFPSPGDLPNPGIKPRSPALWADTLSSQPLGKANSHCPSLYSNTIKSPGCIKKYRVVWDFSGGPVANTLHSQCRRPGFNPGQRTRYVATKTSDVATKDPVCHD